MILIDNNLITLILIELAIFFLIILNYKFISIKFGLFDIPNENRKIHKEPVSVIGGFLIYLVVLSNIHFYGIHHNLGNLFQIITLLVTSLFFFIGYLDDLNKIQLNIKICLILFFIFFLISLNQNLIISKIFIQYFDKQIFLFNFSLVFTLLCIFLLFNAINLMDGANGILLGYFLFFYVIFFSDTNLLFFSINTILIIILFLYNIQTKFFSGNSGANSISIFFSIILITSYNYNLELFFVKKISAETIFIILIIPGLDMLRVFAERIYKSINPFKADNSHLHHLLMKKIKEKLVFIPYLIISFLPYCFLLIGANQVVIIIITLIIYFISIYNLKKIN